MNRKLHNTVTALFATSGLLALSLMAANPLPPSATVPGVAQFAQAAAGAESRAQSPDRLPADAGARLAGIEEAIALAAVAKAFKAEANAEAASARKARSQRGRQSVAMPFFSFFPKG